LGLLFPIYGKKNVPNHQPNILWMLYRCYGFPRVPGGDLLLPSISNKKQAQLVAVAGSPW